MRDKKISGNAGPVIRAIGKRIKRIEKKITSIFSERSEKKFLNGDKMKIFIP